MGQYYKQVCLDKQQYLYTHDFGDGLKLMEFAMSSHGVMAAMALLLTVDNQRRGPWAGNRVVVTGDYADEGRFVPKEYASMNLYAFVSEHGEEDWGERTAESNEQLLAQPKPSFTNAKNLAFNEHSARSLSKLELRQSSRYGRENNLTSAQKVPQLYDDSRVFEQFEDIVEMFPYLAVVEAVERSIEDLLRILRVESVSSSRAWTSVKNARVHLDENAQKMTSVSAEFHHRDNSTIEHAKLTFPAKAVDVRKFLGIN